MAVAGAPNMEAVLKTGGEGVVEKETHLLGFSS